MSKFKNAIVITGSIGSGKSSVLQLLKAREYSVVDADMISHHELNKLTDIVSARYPNVCVNSQIDRKKLGEIVFNNKCELAWLESVLHPKIKVRIYQICEQLQAKDKIYFVDIPLFFEKFGAYEFDFTAVVYAKKDQLISRIMKRNNIKFNDAKNRVELQMDIEKKRQMANFVIDNSTSLDDLSVRVDEFIQNLKGLIC